MVELHLLFLDVCILFYEAVKAELFATDVDHDSRTGRNDSDLLRSISIIGYVISAQHFDNLVFVGEIVQEFRNSLIRFIALQRLVFTLFLTLRVRQLRLVHFLSEGFDLLLRLVVLFEGLKC